VPLVFPAIAPETRLSQVTLAFLDVETTGLSPRLGHRVIEVAVRRVSGGEVEQTFQRLINPCRAVSAGITRLTGISDEMVASAPQFGDIAGELHEMLRGAVIVGHNASFDASFLRSEMSGCGRALCDDLGDPPVLDTLRLARRICRGQRNGLSALCARLGVCIESPAHRAMADCERTHSAMAAMLLPHGGFGLTWREALNLHGRPGTLRDRTAAPTPRLPQLELVPGNILPTNA